MNAALATEPGTAPAHSMTRATLCLAVVLAGHVAVLAWLPAGNRSTSAPAPPLSVTLLAPPPAAPKAVPPAAPAKPPQTQEARAAPEQKAKPIPAPRAKPTPAPPKADGPLTERKAPPQAVLPSKAPTPPQPAASASGSPRADGDSIAPAAPPALPAPANPEQAGARTDGAGRSADAAPSVPEATPPRFDAAYLHNPKPEYPRLARRLGEQGTVLLNVFVDASGVPQKIELYTSSGSPRLDQAARETVQRWKFLPARQGDRAVGAWIVVPIRFVLES